MRVLWETDLRTGHRSVSWPLIGLARIRQARGDLAGADPLFRRAIAIRERVYPEDDLRLLEARERYAELLRLEGR